MNRINEITFNSSLISGYRAIEPVTRLIDRGRLPRGMGPGQYRPINVHRIALEDSFAQLSADSKLDSIMISSNFCHPHSSSSISTISGYAATHLGAEAHAKRGC